jgi:tRNA A-37 threonylcarbamoyl transferase component Bud32
MYIKKFTETSASEITREAQLQKRAAEYGHSPAVQRFNTDSITMEHLDEMCIADKYGEQIRMIPKWIREEIVEILWSLYNELGIHYVDVTPYNFVEKDGRVWILDFGHARENVDVLDPYLERLFDTWKLSRWNPRFK